MSRFSTLEKLVKSIQYICIQTFLEKEQIVSVEINYTSLTWYLPSMEISKFEKHNYHDFIFRI